MPMVLPFLVAIEQSEEHVSKYFAVAARGQLRQFSGSARNTCRQSAARLTRLRPAFAMFQRQFVLLPQSRFPLRRTVKRPALDWRARPLTNTAFRARNI